MAKLFWLQPDKTIVEFPLKAEQNLIGRSSRCDIRIKHPGISAEHAVIRVLPASATLEDLGSTNGTRVNGRRIETHVLRHGDQIGVGRENLMYFAELDVAAEFVQPAPIEPFAQPAPGGESVNTVLSPRPGAREAVSGPSPLSTSRAGAASGVRSASGLRADRGHMPELDPSLIARLPVGASFADPLPPLSPLAATPAPAPARGLPATAAATIPAAPAAAIAPPQHSLSAAIAVLTGPAAGKRYPLEQQTVTIGKEGKQVIECQRIGHSQWQVRQREGVIPAFVNGDALSAPRNLAAGDVIEMTGVRLRFEVVLDTH